MLRPFAPWVVTLAVGGLALPAMGQASPAPGDGIDGSRPLNLSLPPARETQIFMGSGADRKDAQATAGTDGARRPAPVPYGAGFEVRQGRYGGGFGAGGSSQRRR
ncbi:MAG: hypothetical protein RBS40_12220 [Rhodocyclaceae bacterium]|jgi:hypothetical protein|nr:hypothetical protein [Rhodocyclaceae bacterium]